MTSVICLCHFMSSIRQNTKIGFSTTCNSTEGEEELGMLPHTENVALFGIKVHIYDIVTICIKHYKDDHCYNQVVSKMCSRDGYWMLQPGNDGNGKLWKLLRQTTFRMTLMQTSKCQRKLQSLKRVWENHVSFMWAV